MKQLLKAIPIPICGVMLGLAALGNLLQAVLTNILGLGSLGDTLRIICGTISFIIFILLVLKIIFCFSGVKETMNDPVVASVSGTFPMAMMILSAYAKPFLAGNAIVFWFIAILLHIALIIWFTIKFILKFDISKVFASYFIVYVGIAVAGITAPAFGMEPIGAASFLFGLICLMILLIIVTARYIKIPVKEPAKPLFCIYAAPTSLCLAAYIQSVPNKSIICSVILFILLTIIFLIVILKLPSMLALKFYPSYSAFTFPFVITAIATVQEMGFLNKSGFTIPALKYLVIIETFFAAAMVTYSLIRYIIAINLATKNN